MGGFNIGPMELFLVVVVALIVLGPRKLPEIAGQIGRALRDFRRITSDFSSEFSEEIKVIQDTKEEFAKELQNLQLTKDQLTQELQNLETAKNEALQSIKTAATPSLPSPAAVVSEEAAGGAQAVSGPEVALTVQGDTAEDASTQTHAVVAAPDAETMLAAGVEQTKATSLAPPASPTSPDAQEAGGGPASS